jgi:hypothetical protein
MVVRRDQAALYAYLRRGFAGLGILDVILDRRHGEVPPAGSRTALLPEDRRQAVPPRQRSRWRSLGYALVEVRPDAGDPGR